MASASINALRRVMMEREMGKRPFVEISKRPKIC
jgi:hypothetical protein